MIGRHHDFDDSDAEGWDDDPEEEEDDDPTAPCSHCGASVYDDSVRCPACGHDLSKEDDPHLKPWWVVVGVVVCLAIVYRWIFFL